MAKKNKKNESLFNAARLKAASLAPKENNFGMTQADVDAITQRRLESTAQRQASRAAAAPVQTSSVSNRLSAVARDRVSYEKTGHSTYFDDQPRASERLRNNSSSASYANDRAPRFDYGQNDTQLRRRSTQGAGKLKTTYEGDTARYQYERDPRNDSLNASYSHMAAENGTWQQRRNSPLMGKLTDKLGVDRSSQYMTQETDRTVKYDDGRKTEYFVVDGKGDDARLISVPEERYFQQQQLDGGLNPETMTPYKRLQGAAEHGIKNALHGLKSTYGSIQSNKNDQQRAKEYAETHPNGNNLNRRRDMLMGSYGAAGAVRGGDDEKANEYVNQEAMEDIMREREQLEQQKKLDEMYQAYKVGASKPMQLAMDVTDTTANMAPGMLSNFILPGSFIPEMAVQSYGSSYNQARNNGASHDEAVLSGLQNAAVESLSEMMFAGGKTLGKLTGVSGIFRPGKEIEEASLGFIRSTAGKDVVRTVQKLGLAGAEEGAEELVAGIVEPLLDNLIYQHEDINSEWIQNMLHDAAYNALVGFASGGGFGTVDVAQSIRQGADIRAHADVANMIKQGLAMPEDSKSYQLAKRLDVQHKAGESLGNLDVSDLSKAMQESMKTVQEDHDKQMEYAERALDKEGAGGTRTYAQEAYQNSKRADALAEDGKISKEEAALYHSKAGDRFGDLHRKAASEIQSRITPTLPEDASAEEIETAQNEARERAEHVAEPIARILVGEGTASDTASVLGDPNAREVFEQMHGEKLTGSNEEVLKQLNAINSRNHIVYAKEQAQMDKDEIADSVFGDDAAMRYSLRQILVQTDSRDVYPTALAAQEAFIAGRSGSDMAPTAHSDFLTVDQFQKFYDAGRKAKDLYSQSRVELLKKKAAQNKARNEKGEKQKAAVTISNKAKASKKVPGKQMMRFFGRVAKKYGVNIEIVDRSEIQGNANGEFVGNTIRLAADLGSGVRGYIPTFSHEFTHFLEDMAPEAYQKLYEFVLSKSDLTDESDAFRQIVNAKMDLYRQQGLKISLEAAQRECIADMAQTVFTEENLAEFIDIEPNIARDVINAVIDIVNNFIELMKNSPNLNPEGNWIRDLGEYEEYRKMWMDAAKLAAERAESGVRVSEGESRSQIGGKQFNEDKYYSRQIDQWGELKDGVRVKVGEVKEGSALNMVGLPATRMYFDVGKIRKQMSKHSDHITEAVLRGIPDLLNDPIAITEYSKEANTVSVYGNLFIGKTPIVVGVVMTKDRSGALLVNKIRTIHARSDYAKQITDKTVLYLNENKKKTQNWFQVCGISVPLEGTRYGLIRTITYKGESNNRNTQEEQSRKQIALDTAGMIEQNGRAAWLPERINDLMQRYGGTGNYSQAWAVMMNPRDFLKLTLSDDQLDRWSSSAQNVPGEVQGMPYREAVDHVWNKAKETGEWIHDNENYPLDQDELASNEQTPFISIYEDSAGNIHVDGHEGRHRMRALMEAGITSVPVVVKDLSTKYSKTNVDSMTLSSQDFGRGPVNNNASVTVTDLVPIRRDNRDELMEKFGAKDEDQVRFQMQSPVEQKRDLIAVHNLNEEDLMNTIRLGGFPMPSIAVTRTNMGHSKYGTITLLFNKDTIDPKKSKANEIFGGDAYTPTFPSVDRKINDQVVMRVRKRIEDILGADIYDLPFGLKDPGLDSINAADKLQYREPYDAYGNSDVFKIAYLQSEKGFDVAIPMKEGDLKGHDRDFWELIEDHMPEFTISDIYSSSMSDVMERYEPAVRNAMKAYYKAKYSGNDAKLGIQKALLAKYDKPIEYSEVLRIAEGVAAFREYGIKQVIDQDALSKILDDRVDEEGYRKWIDGLFEGIIEKEGIRNSKDPYTPSGNRRSWEALHDPVTLENVVKSMKQQLSAGANGLFGSNPKGAAQKKYGSISEVRADKDRLRMLSDEEFGRLESEATDMLSNVCASIASHNQGKYYNPFGSILDTGEYIAEILNRTRDKASIKRSLEKDYNLEVTDEEMDDLMEAIDAIANLPTGYFEAKPRRAVGLDEIRTAVIPDTASAELKDALDQNGIEYTEYKEGDEEDRKAKVNEAAEEKDLRFQLSASLSKDIDAVLDNTFPSETSEVRIGTSSTFLTKVLGARQLMHLMPANKVYSAIVSEEQAKEDGRYREGVNYHDLGKDHFMAAMEAAEEPVIAFVSTPDLEEGGSKRENRVVIVTDELDDDGNNIVVVEELDSRGWDSGKRVNANKSITTFGRDYIRGLVNDAIGSDRVLYYDDKKISTVAGGPEVQFLDSRQQAYFDKNIDDFWANVNYKKNKGKLSTGESTDTRMAEKLAKAQAEKDARDAAKEVRRQLQTDRDREIADLQNKVERLQRDKRRTYGREASNADATRVARALLADTSSDFSLNQTIKAVKELFTMIKRGDDFADIYGYVQGIARSIADSSYDMVEIPGASDLADLRQRFLDARKSQGGSPLKILIPQNLIGDFDRVGGWKEFRAAHKGIVTLSVNSGESYDSFIEGITDEFGEQFNVEGDNSGIDTLISIIEAADSQEARNPVRKAYKDEDVEGVMPDDVDMGIMGGYRDTEVNEIIDRLLDDVADQIAPDLTFADKKAAEKDAAVKKERAKWEARREQWRKDRDKRIAEMKEDKKLAVEAQRAKGKERLQKQAELYRRQREKARERRADNASRRKTLDRIYKTTQRLSQKLLKPTDSQHIPEKYRKAVADMLGWLDFENARTDQWAKRHGNVPSARILNMRKLQEVYAKIAEDEQLNQYIEPDDQIYEWLEYLSDIEGSRLDDLTTEQLRTVRLVLDAVSWQVNNADKALTEGLKQSRADIATELMDELEAQKDEKFSDGTFKKFIKADSTPVHFFERLGLNTLKKLYQQLTLAQDTHIKHLSEAQEYIEKNITSKWGNTAKVGNNSLIKKWTEESAKYELENGKTVEMTGAQVMSLYALNKREQARKHLLGGGIVIAPTKVKRNLKGGIKEYMLDRQLQKTRAELTYTDITKILGKMSQEQTDAAEAMLKYLKTTSEWGNETSMKLYGYRKFTEDNYFPIQSAKEFIAGSNLELQRDKKIKNQGITKNVNEYANNPIVIDDFFEVTTAHINQMSQYNSFVPILEDFDRIYQYSEYDPETQKYHRSVKELIEQKHGRWAADYIENLLKNVNGNYGNEVADIQGFEKLLRNWKAAKIGLSVRVLAQQPTAVVRAFNEIDPKYFVGTPKRGSHKRMWEICPIAEWKHWGYSQTDIHRSMRDTMMGDKHLSDKLFFDMYGKADDLGWGAIFDAVERETKDLMKKGKLKFEYDSAEYRQHVNERFRHIVDRTQVVDSVLHRSQLMRSQNTLTKAMTAFMAEPTISVNTIMTAFTKAQEEARAGHKAAAAKAASRGVGVFVANAVAVSLMASLISAIRESYLPDDDDDDEEKELSRLQQMMVNMGFEEGSFMYDWISGYFIEDFKDNINPLMMIPVAKDMLNMWQGYEAPNPMYQLPQSLIQTTQNMKKWIDEDGDTRYSGRYYIERAAESVAELFGVPAANIRKELIGIQNIYFRAISEKEYGDYLQDRWELNEDYKSNKNIFIDHYLNAKKAGHDESAKDIREQLLKSKVRDDEGNLVFTDEAIQKRAWSVYAPNFKDDVIAGRDVSKQEKDLKSVGITAEDIDDKKSKALVSSISDAVEMGDTDRLEDLYGVLEKYGYGEYDVDKKVKSAASDLMYDAIDAENYDEADRYINVITDVTGYTRDDVVSSITTHYMSSYYEAMDTGDSAGVNRVTSILGKYGVSSNTIREREAEHYKDYYRQKAYMAYSSGNTAEAYRIATEYNQKYPGVYSKGVDGMIYGIQNLSDETVRRYNTSGKYAEWQLP